MRSASNFVRQQQNYEVSAIYPRRIEVAPNADSPSMRFAKLLGGLPAELCEGVDLAQAG